MSTTPALADALAGGAVVLDGGMSNQLAAAGHDRAATSRVARCRRRIGDAHHAPQAGARAPSPASLRASGSSPLSNTNPSSRAWQAPMRGRLDGQANS
ncbi:hypothetical protein SGRIM128S_02793 [Streptomyces griseomycini]